MKKLTIISMVILLTITMVGCNKNNNTVQEDVNINISDTLNDKENEPSNTNDEDGENNDSENTGENDLTNETTNEGEGTEPETQMDQKKVQGLKVKHLGTMETRPIQSMKVNQLEKKMEKIQVKHLNLK